jgi:hypothetical protein
MHRMVAITAFPSPVAVPARRRPSPQGAGQAPLRSVPAAPRRRLAVGRGVSWALVALVALAAVAFLARSTPAGPMVEGIPLQDATHVVEPGDSMWSVANEVAPAGEAAAYVERLVEVNGSASVAPGQVLVLPVP